MGYSNIDSFRVVNFRNIGDVTIDFSKSPIIALTGDNESGKTSIIKALIVLTTNSFTTKHKKYIRTGTRGWGVVGKLEDGTMITRMKTHETNHLAIQTPDGKTWSTNKIDRGGIPVELLKIMGIDSEPETGEFLNFRTYENKLLFVDTSDSANYKIMYNALQVRQLTNAFTAAIEISNTLKSSINHTSIIMGDIRKNLSEIKVLDIEPVVNIRNRVKEQLKVVNKAKEANSLLVKLLQIKKSLTVDEKIRELREIDIALANRLNELEINNNKRIECMEKIMRYEGINECSEVDESSIRQLKELKLAVQSRNNIEHSKKRLAILNEIGEAEELNTDNIERIMSNIQQAIHNREIVKSLEDKINKFELCGLQSIDEVKESSIGKLNKLLTALNKKSQVEVTINSINEKENQINRLNQVLIESGAIVVECEKCGEVLVVDKNDDKQYVEYHQHI